MKKNNHYYADTILENRGWLKISDNHIYIYSRITSDQKTAIIKYADIMQLENIRVNSSIISIDEFKDEKY